MLLTALIIEVEQPEGISTRKLVLETERHNVLTAYTGDGGLDLMRRFPNVDVVVVHTEVDDLPFGEVVRQVKEIRPDVKVVALAPDGNRDPEGADYVISSYDPQTLLKLLAKEFRADV